MIEGDTQRQQQVEPDAAAGWSASCSAASAAQAGAASTQLAGGVEGGLLGVPDRLQRQRRPSDAAMT